MRIGEEVTYNGRRSAVRGFTPISVTPISTELSDAKTDTSFWIEWPAGPGRACGPPEVARRRQRTPRTSVGHSLNPSVAEKPLLTLPKGARV
jgi:hypothetical protein